MVIPEALQIPDHPANNSKSIKNFIIPEKIGKFVPLKISAVMHCLTKIKCQYEIPMKTICHAVQKQSFCSSCSTLKLSNIDADNH